MRLLFLPKKIKLKIYSIRTQRDSFQHREVVVNWMFVKTCSCSSEQTVPIEYRRSKDVPIFVAYYVLVAVKTIIGMFVPKKSGVLQLWIQIKSKIMCRTREIPRV